MTLTSFNFLCFFAVLFVLYYLVPHKAQNALLLLANAVFCYFAGGIYLVLFLSILTLITYFGAIIVERYKEGKKQTCVVIITVLICMTFLIALKYVNFFIYTGNGLCSVFGGSYIWSPINIIAPLGISFFTLQLLGYFFDVQRQLHGAEKNILKYFVFASFFPQIISGPINKYSDMQPQLSEGRKFDYDEFKNGLLRMAWGFFKKLVISERMAVIVNAVYSDYHAYTGFYIVIATICFAVQLYTDFSGYMDIALGAAQVLRIKMAENFQTPFFSRSISEYWRRWHITLGVWFKDYVFYPILKSDLFVKIGNISKKKLGKKRGKKVPTYIGMVVLWFLTGLWHGGSWNFIIGSGLLHCFYIVGGQLLEPVFERMRVLFRVNTEWFGYRLFQIIRTFILVCIGFVFFRAASLTDGIKMLGNIFTFDISVFKPDNFFALGLSFSDLIVALVSLLVLFAVSLIKEKTDVRELLSKQNIVIRWGVYYALIFAIIIFGYYGLGFNVGDFIYQQF